MTTIPDHATSYETGQRPFKPDPKREKWAISGDFFFACISNVFNSTHFSNVAYLIFIKHQSITLTLVYYVLCMALYVLPLMFIQTFLGQFSSTGYISAFRIAPIFKGLGYVIFLLNFVVLSYVVIFAAVPLLYAVTSTFSVTDIISCNNSWNSQNCSVFKQDMFDEHSVDSVFYPQYNILAAHEFYNHHLKIDSINYDSEDVTFVFNWSIFAYAIAIWCLIGLVMSRGVQWIGRANRYISLSLMITLLLLVIRAFSVSNLMKVIGTIFDFTHITSGELAHSFALAPLICFQTFGRGWGTPLVMASHNDFEAKAHHLSAATVAASTLLTLACTSVTVVCYGILDLFTFGFHLRFMHPLTSLYVAFPTVFGSLPASQLWLLLFFLMISLSEISSIVIQLSGLLTSFFDEFDQYRDYKDRITYGVIGFLGLTSIFYCSNHGFAFFRNVIYFQIFSQALIFMLLLLIVMWVYGRRRFQRDIYFMLNVVFPRTLIVLIRYVTPVLVFIIGAIGFLMLIHSEFMFDHYEQIFAFLMKYIPWLILPGYIIFRLSSNVGSIPDRFKRLSKPTDWYPLDIDQRQKYEATLGDSDMSHQLTECTILNEDCGEGDE